MSPGHAIDWLTATQRLLEERLVEGGGGSQPVLFVQRQGTLSLLMSSGDPWVLVNLAAHAVSGFAGDEVIFASDTYVSKSRTNPEGRPWRSGEMGERANEPAVAALLGEAVAVLRARRTCPSEAATVEYERQAGGRIKWGKARSVEMVGGRMIGVLHEAARATWLTEIMAGISTSPQDFGLSERAGEVHRQMATVRAMAELAQRAKTVVVFGVPTSDDPAVRAIVKESMERAKLKVDEVPIPDRAGPEWWGQG